jgi:1,4-dihydroxy-2-naphthoyl-CoA hydrolase
MPSGAPIGEQLSTPCATNRETQGSETVQDDQIKQGAHPSGPERRELDIASGFNGVLGFNLLECTAQRVLAELTVSERHHQPWGIVHGGVYCSIIETVCSLGAQLAQTGGFVVGVDNHTSFLKATRAGTLRASARPLAAGKRTQLWEANIENAAGELVATGRVRLMTIAAGAQLAGEPAAAAGPRNPAPVEARPRASDQNVEARPRAREQNSDE